MTSISQTTITTTTYQESPPLPQDCYFSVFLFLNKRQLAKISTVCQNWNALINGQPQTLWRHLAAQHYPVQKFFFPPSINSNAANPLAEETLQEEVKKIYAMVSKCKALIPDFLTCVGNTMIRCLHQKTNPRIEEPFPLLSAELSNADLKVFHNGHEEIHSFLVAGPLYLIKGFNDNNPFVRLAASEAFKKLASYFESHCELHFDWKNKGVVCMTQQYITLHHANHDPEKEKLPVILMDLFNKNLVLIQGFSHQSCISKEERNQIFEEIAKLQPISNWKEIVVSRNHRKFYDINLCDIHDSLLASSQDTVFKEIRDATSEEKESAEFAEKISKSNELRLKILELSGKALIGLCQRDSDAVLKFKTPDGRLPRESRYFAELGIYLHNPEFSFIQNNNVNSTSTLRKAAVLYIIQGLHSENEEIRKTALKIIFKFVKDYFQCSAKILTKSHTHPKEILFELAMGYWISANAKDPVSGNAKVSIELLCSNVRKIFRDDIELLKEFSAKLPVSDDNKKVLDVVIDTMPSSENKDS